MPGGGFPNAEDTDNRSFVTEIGFGGCWYVAPKRACRPFKESGDYNRTLTDMTRRRNSGSFKNCFATSDASFPVS